MESESNIVKDEKVNGEEKKCAADVDEEHDAEYESEDEEVEEGEGRSDAKMEAARLTGELMKNPQVLAAFEAKLGGMIGKNSGYVETLPKSVRRRIKALKKLQSEMFNVESKFHEEVHELERKYSEQYKPLCDKREAIVNARVEPTDSECDWPSDEEEEDEEIPKAKIVEIDETKPEGEQVTEEDKTQGIPEFWLTIFKNIDALDSLIQENDTPILQHLKDVRVKNHPAENMGFTLEFVFEENEYFSNTILTKEYSMTCKPDPDSPLSYVGPQINSCKGCKIDWKPNKDVTVRKQKHKVKGTKKTVTKLVKVESFFNYFSPPQVKTNADECNEEDDDKRQQLLEDWEIADMLRSSVIPKAVLYFTGEALSDDEDDDEDAEYDEDEDEDDDEDPDYVPPANGATGPPECKQQ